MYFVTKMNFVTKTSSCNYFHISLFKS